MPTSATGPKRRLRLAEFLKSDNFGACRPRDRALLRRLRLAVSPGCQAIHVGVGRGLKVGRAAAARDDGKKVPGIGSSAGEAQEGGDLSPTC